MSLEDQFRLYAKKHPEPATGEKSWNQMCGSLMFRFSQFVTPSFNPPGAHATAWDAALSSGPLNKDAAAAPLGAYHFWHEAIIPRPGHVGIDLRGGGTHIGMATFALAESLGQAIGIQSITGYSKAKSFMKYAGWSTNYAGARIDLSGFASVGSTPAVPPPTPKGDDTMIFISKDSAGKYWMTIPGEHVEISQPEAALFDGTANEKKNRSDDEMFNIAKLAGRFEKPSEVTITQSAATDPAAIAAAVVKSLPKPPTHIIGTLS